MAEASFAPLRIAVLTVSDTRQTADDQSGALLAERIVRAGHCLAGRKLVADEVLAIRSVICAWVRDPVADVIITTGGTGLTLRDVTPDAVEPLFDKRIDGFSVAFHLISHRSIGASTIQSRATAGLIGGVLVFCLPGSPGACRDGWDQILVSQLDRRHRPCNFAELLPRIRASA